MPTISCHHLWETDLDQALAARDLFQQAAYLEHRIALLDAWLAAHPEADDIWYERLQELADRHAEVLDRLALLRSGQPVEIAVRLPATYDGPVGSRWEVLDSGELVAWFTPAELEAAAWAWNALRSQESTWADQAA